MYSTVQGYMCTSTHQEAWRSLKELVIFKATTYIRKGRRQLLVKSWYVSKNTVLMTVTM